MNQMQAKVKNFVDIHNMQCPLDIRALDLVSEVGELSKEIIKMSNYGKTPLQMRDEIKSELGDVVFALTVLANQLDVNLEESLNLVLEKMQNRITAKGSAASGK